jgi:hypothetical protein
VSLRNLQLLLGICGAGFGSLGCGTIFFAMLVVLAGSRPQDVWLPLALALIVGAYAGQVLGLRLANLLYRR